MTALLFYLVLRIEYFTAFVVVVIRKDLCIWLQRSIVCIVRRMLLRDPNFLFSHLFSDKNCRALRLIFYQGKEKTFFWQFYYFRMSANIWPKWQITHLEWTITWDINEVPSDILCIIHSLLSVFRGVIRRILWTTLGNAFPNSCGILSCSLLL